MTDPTPADAPAPPTVGALSDEAREEMYRAAGEEPGEPGPLGFLKEAVGDFLDDRCTSLAAGLAYYTIFSLPPLLYLIFVLLIWGLTAWYGEGGREQAETYFNKQVSLMLGNPGAQEEVGNMVDNVQEGTGGSWWKTLLSVGGIVVGATGVVAALQDSLNQAWEVEADPDRAGWKNLILKRVMSLGLILGFGFLLLVSFAVSAVLEMMTGAMGDAMGAGPWIQSILNYAVTFAVLGVLFAAIFKYMPDAVVDWRDVAIGAAVTAVLFLVGKFGLQVYLNYSNPASQVGSAAASLVVLLVWVYYSAMILLFGAECTQVWAKRYGRGIVPEEGAVRVVRRRVKAGATAA